MGRRGEGRDASGGQEPRRRPPSWLLAPSGLLATLLVAGAFGLVGQERLDPAPLPAAHPAEVVVVGDSITRLSTQSIRQATASYRVDVLAVNGARAAAMLPAARAAAAPGVGQLIVNLGTNDMLSGADVGSALRSVEEIVSDFPRATCVHLVTVSSSIIDFTDLGLPARTARFDAGLRRLGRLDPRIDIVDWSGTVHDYLAAGQPHGSLLIDTVHPTAVGQRLLAQQYAAALRACPRG